MKLKPIAEIIGPDGRVHYVRPIGHPDIEEAKKTAGYSVREWRVNPDYAKADSEVVLYAHNIAVGPCKCCELPTNGMMGEDFVCSFCQGL